LRCGIRTPHSELLQLGERCDRKGLSDRESVAEHRQIDRGVPSLFSTTTIFGTPVDVTLAEPAIESFFPADPGTGAALRAIGLAAVSRSG
jgi:hypothetical protein